MSGVYKEIQKKVTVAVFSGPPINSENDDKIVNRFLNWPGKHIVCGGSTAKIVARYLGKPINVDLKTCKSDVPPLVQIEGIDLVSEGILTLTKVLEYLKSNPSKVVKKDKTNGASRIFKMLLDADNIHFFVGKTVNPVHENPDLPNKLTMRCKVIKEIIKELQNCGKEVSIELD